MRLRFRPLAARLRGAIAARLSPVARRVRRAVAPLEPILARALAAIAALLVELARIVREALVIPAQLWMATAELAGAGVLAAWRVIVAVALAAYARARAALHWAQVHVRPSYGVFAVALAAAATLLVSQFLDYRGIAVGAPAYSEVQAIAPAPEVDRQRTGAAHAWVLIPVAIGALVVTALAMRGRWRAARLLVPLGLAVVAISLAIDAPKGLDTGAATTAYEGVEAVLLEGFWAQLLAGAVLACCGLLLAARPAAERAPARGDGRSGRRSLGSSRVAQPPMGGETSP